MPRFLLSQIDISKLKVLSVSDYGWVRYTSFELERVEMPSKVKYITLRVTEENGRGFQGYCQGLTNPTPLSKPVQWRETRRHKITSIRKKYLCIGGGLDGQMHTSTDAGDEYIFYNRSVGSRRKKAPTGILVNIHWVGIKSGIIW